MNTGRIPACTIDSPTKAENITSAGQTFLTGADDNHKLLTMQGGNRCGHDRNQFKKPTLHGGHKRRPHAIEEAKRRIERSVSNIYAFPELSQIFYHPLKNGKGRRRRSERIEAALSLTLYVLLHLLNLHRMAAGYYDSANTFRFYNYGLIESLTGLSPIRTKRAMALLQALGFIKTFAIRELNHDGSYRTTQVRIEFTDKIFQALEMMPEFLKDRETASIKFYEKQARLDNNRAKKDFYKKPTFTVPEKSRNGKKREKAGSIVEILKSGLAGLTNKLSVKPSKGEKGSGEQRTAELNALVRSGLSIPGAFKILSQKYRAPPN